MMLTAAAVAMLLVALAATCVFVALRRWDEGDYISESFGGLRLGARDSAPLQERIRELEQQCPSADPNSTEGNWCSVHRRARPQFTLRESGDHWKLTIRFRWFLGGSYTYEGDYEPEHRGRSQVFRSHSGEPFSP
jgi:hypothetical protein